MNVSRRTPAELLACARSNDPAAPLRDLCAQLRGEATEGPRIGQVYVLPTVIAALDLVQAAIPTLDNLSLANFTFRLGDIVERANTEYCRRMSTHEQPKKGHSRC